jgi:hypothetical protein
MSKQPDASVLTPGAIASMHKLASRPSSEQQPVTVQVLAVKRYLIDPSYGPATGQGSPHCPSAYCTHGLTDIDFSSVDAFDIVLSDGAHRLKAVLACALNTLVYRNDIQPGVRCADHHICKQTD